MAIKNEILLESGTNELEIMEFTISGNVFGINVAKVTEIMKFTQVNPMPNAHPNVEGVFKPRTDIITVINLPAYMGLPPSSNNERDMFIITNFNKMHTAFHVHTVEGIHRVNWANIEKPDSTIYGGTEGLATGIAKVKDKLITIIDFEKIVFEISPQSGIQISEVTRMGIVGNNKPIIVAEDSALLKKMLVESLETAGYTNITAFTNGMDCWEYLCEVAQHEDDIKNRACCLITDIEMPKMDGHRLIKLIREDKKLKHLPVIVFSSLIDEAMYDKGVQLGASAQLSKPEIGSLVHMLSENLL